MLHEGLLLRIWQDSRAGIPGFLEDYAHVASGLLALFEVDRDDRWVRAARALSDEAIARFRDDGVFFDTGSHHEALVLRPRDPYDNAIPSGNSAICDVLLRLHALTGQAGYRAIALEVLESQASIMARLPIAFGRLLCAADLALAGCGSQG